MLLNDTFLNTFVCKCNSEMKKYFVLFSNEGSKVNNKLRVTVRKNDWFVYPKIITIIAQYMMQLHLHDIKNEEYKMQ